MNPLRVAVIGRAGLGAAQFATLAMLLAVSCIGDTDIEVTLVNDTTQTLTVYPHGREYATTHWTLAPAERITKALLNGDGRADYPVARLEAVTTDGVLVFCHQYTNGELAKLDRLVRLKAGTLDCR